MVGPRPLSWIGANKEENGNMLTSIKKIGKKYKEIKKLILIIIIII